MIANELLKYVGRKVELSVVDGKHIGVLKYDKETQMFYMDKHTNIAYGTTWESDVRLSFANERCIKGIKKYDESDN